MPGLKVLIVWWFTVRDAWSEGSYCLFVGLLSEMPGLKVLIVWWFTVKDAWSEGSYCLVVYCQRCLV